MKRLLISTACAIFICGTACAREVTLSPTFTLHGSTGELCTTEYIPTRDDRAAVFRVKRLEGATACDP